MHNSNIFNPFNSTIHYQNKKSKFCNNCHKNGHFYKNCNQPNRSHGIICFQQFNDTIYYLMINRKHSYNFIEFIKGQYMQYNVHSKSWYCKSKYVYHILSNLSAHERSLIHKELTTDTFTFKDLWLYLWTYDTDKRLYEYKQCLKKYQAFRKGLVSNGYFISLQLVLKKTKCHYALPEWGFPKGKKNRHETDIQTSLREFEEETNIPKSKIKIYFPQALLEEYKSFNGRCYSIQYFVAQYLPEVQETFSPKIGIDPNNKHQTIEIGDVQWLTLPEALQHIRASYHIKKNILKQVHQRLLHTLKNTTSLITD